MENLALNPLPPALEVTGTWRDDPQARVALVNHFYSSETVTPYSGESPQTPEQTKQLTALGSAFLELGRDLGLDLQSRIPTPDKYHFFRTKEDFDAVMRGMGIPTDETTEAMTLLAGIFIVDRGDDFINMCAAAHETVHFMAQKKVGTGNSAEANGNTQIRIKAIRGGYKHQKWPENETFQGLDELATDLTYQHLLNGGYWDRQPDLPNGGDRRPTFYTSLDVIGDELIQATAKYIGVDPLTVLRGIEKDILTGRGEGLRAVTDYLKSSSPKGIRELIHAPIADPNNRFKKLADDLALPAAIARIEGLERDKDKPTDVLKWARVHNGVGFVATAARAD